MGSQNKLQVRVYICVWQRLSVQGRENNSSNILSGVGVSMNCGKWHVLTFPVYEEPIMNDDCLLCVV